MPDSYNDRSLTTPGAPKPARTASATPVLNTTPGGGTTGGGLDNIRAGYETYATTDSRPQTSGLKRTGAAIDSYKDATV